MRFTHALHGLLKVGSLLTCSLLAACSPKPEATAPAAQSTAESAPTSAAQGTVHALITVPIGASMPANYNERVAALRQVAGVTNVLALQAQPGPEPSGFQSLAVVDFADEASLTEWLSAASADTDWQVRRADVLSHDASAGAAAAATNSFYVVNHYEALVSPAEYKTYSESYVVPNMAHQKSTGAMLAYTMYLEREPEGVKPKAVLVKQYVSPEEHARAEEAKDTYKRDVLMKQPEWKQINDTKAGVRNDLTETLARPTA